MDALDFMTKLQSTKSFIECMEDKFSFVTPDLRNLLINMLKFNPSQRWSVQECLQSPIFNKIRVIKNEKVAEEKIELDIENLKLGDITRLLEIEISKVKM